MATYRQLVFRPDHNVDAALTQAGLAQVLTELGIVGELITHERPYRYFIGERFLQHLSFMGCAPALEFEPAGSTGIDWSGFTYVMVSPLFQQPRFLVDELMARPRCPACQARQSITKALPRGCRDKLICQHCETANPIAAWSWREFGGCSRIYFSIVNVYPKESIPTDSFLQRLAVSTSIDWQFFYANDELPESEN